MTNEYKYETIESEIPLGIFRLLYWDFRPSKEMMTDLAKKIEQYEQKRGMETKYHKKICSNGEEKLLKIEMNSKDSVVRGIIIYEPVEPPSPLISTPFFPRAARIQVKLNFNSNNEADKTEYQGLIKILKNM